MCASTSGVHVHVHGDLHVDVDVQVEPDEHWRAVAAEGLALPTIAPDATGLGATIAIVDTGVAFDHPHLALAPRGFGIDRDPAGVLQRIDGPDACGDRYGHGTCCAALIHLLAPEAALFAVRVTDAQGRADTERLARGIELAAAEGAEVVCVALGTETGARARVDGAIARAVQAGAVVVAADPGHGRRVLPAHSPDVLGVRHRDGVDVAVTKEGTIVAEGRARPSPQARNFWGSSLGAARAAAALARRFEATKDRGEALRRGFKKALIVL
jgi:subtilisin family serine protease